MKPWSGVIGEDGVEIQRVAVARATSGEVTDVTPPNLHVYEFDWAPNSQRARLRRRQLRPAKTTGGSPSSTPSEIGRRPPSHASILDTPAPPAPSTACRSPSRASPPTADSIAFIGGLMRDQGSTGGDIYSIPATAATPRRHHARQRPSRPPGSSGPATTNIRSSRARPAATSTLRLRRRHRQRSPRRDRDLPAVHPRRRQTPSASSPRRRASPSSPPPSTRRPRSIRAVPRQRSSQLTHLNDGLKPVWGKSRIHRVGERRLPRPGLAPLPRQLRPRQEVPAHRQRPRRPVSLDRLRAGAGGGALYSALGYFVFSPNPRGSYGQGEKFTQANIKDFGYGDLRDILAGMDVLEKQLPHRQESRRPHRLELRRLHDHVRRHPDPPLPRRRRRRRHLRLAELLRRKLHRPVDGPVLRRNRLRRPGRLRQVAPPSTTSRTSKRPRSSSSATATANAPPRRASSSGTPSAPKASRPSSSSTPTKATASATPPTSATATSGRRVVRAADARQFRSASADRDHHPAHEHPRRAVTGNRSGLPQPRPLV